MSRITDWLKRDFNATDEELTELMARHGDCESAEPTSVVAAFAMLKIERLEKRIVELEPKKCERNMKDPINSVYYQKIIDGILAVLKQVS